MIMKHCVELELHFVFLLVRLQLRCRITCRLNTTLDCVFLFIIVKKG